MHRGIVPWFSLQRKCPSKQRRWHRYAKRGARETPNRVHPITLQAALRLI